MKNLTCIVYKGIESWIKKNKQRLLMGLRLKMKRELVTIKKNWLIESFT